MDTCTCSIDEDGFVIGETCAYCIGRNKVIAKQRIIADKLWADIDAEIPTADYRTKKAEFKRRMKG